ncbi:MAG: RsmB/NOP family class I SAM-dependent RNA methyltransferase [Elsteraceae bacterium]
MVLTFAAVQEESAQGQPVRRAAQAALAAVLRRQQPLDEALTAAAVGLGLELRDRAFLRQLTTTTLRALGVIDRALASRLKRPNDLPPSCLDALRLGAAQLLFLDTPAHAAVDGAVNSLPSKLGSAQRGLVNAVLRRIAADGPKALEKVDRDRATLPGWLWTRLIAAYGEEVARAAASAMRTEPPLDVTLRDAEPGDWPARLEATLLPTGTLRRVSEGRVEALSGFDEGAWWIQDAAAALPAKLLGPVKGLRVADLCAAPGGKTAQLLSFGAEVTAVDRSPARLERLKRNMERLGYKPRIVAADAARWRPETPFDAILLDAPCTATGTLRRHPDVAWTKTPKDLTALTGLQDRLLTAAVEMLRPGGTLVYCTCSLLPEEGEARIDALLASGAPVERAPLDAGDCAESSFITARGELRTLPGAWAEQGGLDGFFAARLRRIAVSG